jgi:isopenicillin-N N-acyltransferase-like protein
MARLVREAHGRIDVAAAREILTDHEGSPTAICRHPAEGAHPLESVVTVASVIMDLAAARLDLTFGRPCESERETLVPGFARQKQPA